MYLAFVEKTLSDRHSGDSPFHGWTALIAIFGICFHYSGSSLVNMRLTGETIFGLDRRQMVNIKHNEDYQVAFSFSGASSSIVQYSSH